MTANALAEKIKAIADPFNLVVITSRGLKIWPESMIETPDMNQCQCRFLSGAEPCYSKISHGEINRLLDRFEKIGLDVVKTESLYTFDGKVGFTLLQGQ